jgi:hypothetical protein
MGSCPFSENHVNVWDAEVEVESLNGDVPWDIGHRAEKFRLVSLNDSYVGLSSTSPQYVLSKTLSKRLNTEYFVLKLHSK